MKIKVEFKNAEEERVAEEFLTWLCEAGEQDYWNWMECRDEEKNLIGHFDYDFKKMTVDCEIDPNEAFIAVEDE